MEDITLVFWCAGLIVLVLQYFIKAPPVYLLGEVFGVGGLVCTVNEANAGVLDSSTGLLMTIAMVVVMIYSAWNLIGYYWPGKGWKQ